MGGRDGLKSGMRGATGGRLPRTWGMRSCLADPLSVLGCSCDGERSSAVAELGASGRLTRRGRERGDEWHSMMTRGPRGERQGA